MADPISPLHDLAIPGEYGALTERAGVTLCEDLPEALVQVSCWPDTQAACEKAMKSVLGTKIETGRMANVGKNCVALPTGLGRWLVESEDADLETKLRKKIPAKTGSVTGLTHGRMKITVSGEKAAWLLATGIALDFHLSAFPVGRVEVTHHHEVGLTIHRTGEEVFELYLFTSFARSFWQWLVKAAGEVGYRVI